MRRNLRIHIGVTLRLRLRPFRYRRYIKRERRAEKSPATPRSGIRAGSRLYTRAVTLEAANKPGG